MYTEVLGFFSLKMEQPCPITPERITNNNALENKLKLKKNSAKEMREKKGNHSPKERK